jgi:N,N-dimethylformamidase
MNKLSDGPRGVPSGIGAQPGAGRVTVRELTKRFGPVTTVDHNFGLRGNDAGCIEVDRVEPTLGSPPGVVWLATADRLSYGNAPSPEEMRTLHRGLTGDENAQVRADLVFFPTAEGGALFSTSSIARVCALSHNSYDNNVSRLTGNVLTRFLDKTPIEPTDPQELP